MISLQVCSRWVLPCNKHSNRWNIQLTSSLQNPKKMSSNFVLFVSSRSRRYSASVRMTWQLKRHWYWTARMKSTFGLDSTQMLHPRSKHLILARLEAVQNLIYFAFKHNTLWNFSFLFVSTFLQMFLQDGILHDRRSIETTVYVITEGDEPAFFTDFFKWDSSKQSSVSAGHTATYIVEYHRAQLSSLPVHELID